jgi:hypothetical protein
MVRFLPYLFEMIEQRALQLPAFDAGAKFTLAGHRA